MKAKFLTAFDHRAFVLSHRRICLCLSLLMLALLISGCPAKSLNFSLRSALPSTADAFTGKTEEYPASSYRGAYPYLGSPVVTELDMAAFSGLAAAPYELESYANGSIAVYLPEEKGGKALFLREATEESKKYSDEYGRALYAYQACDIRVEFSGGWIIFPTNLLDEYSATLSEGKTYIAAGQDSFLNFYGLLSTLYPQYIERTAFALHGNEILLTGGLCEGFSEVTLSFGNDGSVTISAD